MIRLTPIGIGEPHTHPTVGELNYAINGKVLSTVFGEWGGRDIRDWQEPGLFCSYWIFSLSRETTIPGNAYTAHTLPDPKFNLIQEPLPRSDHLVFKLLSIALVGSLPSLPFAVTEGNLMSQRHSTNSYTDRSFICTSCTFIVPGNIGETILSCECIIWCVSHCICWH